MKNKFNKSSWWIKTLIWSIFCTALIITFSGCGTTHNTAYPFQGTTKNHPMHGRMTQQQWRHAQQGENIYIRRNGNVIRNTMHGK
jgi:hypothetical protein